MKLSLRQSVLTVLLVFLIGATGPLQAHPGAEEMAKAASAFLQALTPEQRGAAVFDLKSDERFNWHYIPKNDRKGVQFKDLTPAQRERAMNLLRTSLSAQGYTKATSIMALESILHELEKNRKPPGNVRDPERYFVSIFGTPGPKATWGWRFEGHHLSLNFTLVEGKVVTSTPSFLGSNPARVLDGPQKGLRVLAREEDLARQLVKSLNAEQKKTAIFDSVAPKEIFTAAERKVKPLETAGIPAAQLTEQQRSLLVDLIKEYLYRSRPDVAADDLAKIQKAGLDQVRFAWAGGTETGEGHYYRVQGPTFLLEYDNTQNNNNHIHAVWRDFENDFGEDLLRKHYQQYPHGK